MVSNKLNKCGPYNNNTHLTFFFFCRLILLYCLFFFNKKNFSNRVIRSHIKIKTRASWIYTKQMSEKTLLLQVIFGEMHCFVVKFSLVSAVVKLLIELYSFGQFSNYITFLHFSRQSDFPLTYCSNVEDKGYTLLLILKNWPI